MTRKTRKIEELAEYVDSHDFSEEMAGGVWDDAVVPEPMVGISIRLPKAVMDELRKVAEVRGVRTTQLMREWLEEKLAREAESGEEVVAVSEVMAFLAERAVRRPAAKRPTTKRANPAKSRKASA